MEWYISWSWHSQCSVKNNNSGNLFSKKASIRFTLLARDCILKWKIFILELKLEFNICFDFKRQDCVFILGIKNHNCSFQLSVQVHPQVDCRDLIQYL